MESEIKNVARPRIVAVLPPNRRCEIARPMQAAPCFSDTELEIARLLLEGAQEILAWQKQELSGEVNGEKEREESEIAPESIVSSTDLSSQLQTVEQAKAAFGDAHDSLNREKDSKTTMF